MCINCFFHYSCRLNNLIESTFLNPFWYQINSPRSGSCFDSNNITNYVLRVLLVRTNMVLYEAFRLFILYFDVFKDLPSFLYPFFYFIYQRLPRVSFLWKYSSFCEKVDYQCHTNCQRFEKKFLFQYIEHSRPIGRPYLYIVIR